MLREITMGIIMSAPGWVRASVIQKDIPKAPILRRETSEDYFMVDYDSQPLGKISKYHYLYKGEQSPGSPMQPGQPAEEAVKQNICVKKNNRLSRIKSESVDLQFPQTIDAVHASKCMGSGYLWSSWFCSGCSRKAKK